MVPLKIDNKQFNGAKILKVHTDRTGTGFIDENGKLWSTGLGNYSGADLGTEKLLPPNHLKTEPFVC